MSRFFISPKALKKMGILGMNARNSDYINCLNERKLYPLVDDKLQTKKLLEKYQLKAPKLIASIQYQAEVKKMKDFLPQTGGFAIKPAHGSGGKGILIIVDQQEGYYIKTNGEKLSFLDLRRYVSNILSGLHSLGGRNDIALIEHLIEFDDVFSDFSFEGVPDIRVIVYKGYPVMSMMRLPTSQSDGKANLHQGAVGVGINIKTGQAISAVQFNRTIEKHPDTGKLLTELVVPYWDEILYLSSRAYDITKLGYLGADIVIDKKDGPMLLELNARPGLAIQIANSTGLTCRFKQVDAIDIELSCKERIEYMKEKLEF